MPKLQTRRLGRTEMQPKALAMGAAWICHAEECETIEGIQRAYELGINFFDTYPGHAEERWGEALAGIDRDSYYLQAKVGTHPDRSKDFSAEGTRWSVENSLKSLRVDHLDTVLVHDPLDIEVILQPRGCLNELLRMKNEGLIRHLGFGCRPHDFHARAIETGCVDLLLTFLDYTLLDQSVIRTTFQHAKLADVGLILASPLGMGRLTGIEPDAEADRRKWNRDPLAQRMWEWCRVRGVDIKTFAFYFCLNAPVESIVMFGPADRQQIEEGVAAATAEVDDEAWKDFCEEFEL